MLIIDCEVEKSGGPSLLSKYLVTMHFPDTEPPLRLSREEKLKTNFTGKKSLTFISKSLFNLKVQGYQGKFGCAILMSSWMHFMCVRKYLEVFCGLHVIVLRIKTF